MTEYLFLLQGLYKIKLSHYTFSDVKDYEHVELGRRILLHSVYRYVESSVPYFQFGTLHLGAVQFKVCGCCLWRQYMIGFTVSFGIVV
jgi:hypothetical protein